MAFQKCLLNGELMLIAITLSLADKMEYGQIANNTKYEQIANNTGYKNSNDMEYEQIEYDTEYTPIDYNLSGIVPLHYNTEIRFFFEDNILFGQCNIIINISQSLHSIRMHSIPVYVMDAILIDSKNETIYKLLNSFFNKEKNILTLNFYRRLLHHTFPNTFTLNMAYMRVIHENRKSFIRSVYQQNPEDQMWTQTDVEVMKVRQLFPCWDVQTINSTFKITIKHDEKYTVLSNMPIQARKKADNGMMWTEFDESLSLSTQRISFVMTTFTNVSSPLANVTIWCRQSAQNHIIYAKSVLEEVIPYFRQEYLTQLSKLDIVAFRHFQDDNIATLGLVLLREADIIYNEALHPVIRQREVAHVIARLLAFLWCNDALLWSKEGFTTFFGAYILDQVYQNNHMMNLMVVQSQQDSFRYDISSSVNFLTPNNTNICKVNSLESPLNYVKSFIIWRMIYNIIPDVFWRGIRTYISRSRTYSNMETSDDLWTTLQIIQNEVYPEHMFSLHLKDIIISWITKECYPILNVIQHYWNLTLIIKEFKSPYLLYLVNNNTEIWIPVTLTTQSSLNFDKIDDSLFWLTSQKLEHAILGVGKKEWVIVNIQQAGYYRVKYDLQYWEKLIRYLNSENYNKVHILNRAQLIDDAFYFFLQRQVSYNIFWNLTNFVIWDTNFVTWYPMIKAFELMTCLFPFGISFHTVYSAFTQDRIKNRINGLLAEIGYFEESTDNTLTIYLRQEAIKWACILGVPECRRIAASVLNRKFANSVEDNLIGKEWIYCHGLITANHTIWHKIWEKWNATSDKRFLEYLTCSKDSTILCNFLEIITLEKSQPNESKQGSKHINAFFLIVAKNAQRDAMHSCFFKILEGVKFSFNRRNDIIATLIVIITHVHREDHMTEIYKVAMRVLKENLLIKGVREKLKKRRLEFGKLIRNYGFYFSLPAT